MARISELRIYNDGSIGFQRLENERKVYLNQIFKVNSTSLNICLKEKSFSKIIQNQELFFAAIIAAFPIENNQPAFKVVEEMQGHFSIKTTGISLSKNLHKDVETIRKFFVEASNKKENLKLYFTTTCARSFLSTQTENLMSKSNYAIYYLHTSLPKLASFCGAKFNVTTEHTLTNTSLIDQTSVWQDVTIYHFTWPKVYKFKELAKAHDCVNYFYEDYLQGLGCDCTIYSNTRTAIKIQSTILRYCASLPFQTLLNNSPMNDSETPTINLKDFSENTIRAYIDYLYLGGEKFIEKSSSSEGITTNLFEYLMFANTYEDIEFLNCCTNLFGIVCDESDIEMIQSINEEHYNEHLNELLEKLIYDKEKKSNELKTTFAQF